MRRTTLALMLVLMFLVILALPAMAQEPSQPNQRPTPIQIVARFLQLSDDQVHQLETLLTQREQTIRAINEQIRARGQQLETLLNSSNPDPAAVGALVVQIHGLQRQIAQTQESFLAALRNLLNQEQQDRFAAVQRASRLVPVIGAFARLRLLPPPPPGEQRPQQFNVPLNIPEDVFDQEGR